jgi:hypothetical protein
MLEFTARQHEHNPLPDNPAGRLPSRALRVTPRITRVELIMTGDQSLMYLEENY